MFLSRFFFVCLTLISFKKKDFDLTEQKFGCGNMAASNLHTWF